jgi:predicted PurR-regulated permease PerM
MRLRTLESRFFLALVIATTIFFVWVVRGFLIPVFWAAVFATLFRPVFLRTLELGDGRRGLAASVATLAVILIVLIPSGLLVAAVAQQAFGLYARVADGSLDLQAPIALVERWVPPLTEVLARYGIGVEQIRASVESGVVSATQYIGGQALALGQNALRTAILFGLMLYLLFFFFRDGDRIIEGIIRAMPMGDERERRLLTRFAEVSRATVKGTVIVAAVQGTLGGLMFALVGLEAAVLWGVAMGILSLLPAVGPALVWIPAAIVLFATNAIWGGIIVIVGGALVIGLVDNLLRPILVGRGAKLPDYMVLLATLGGITVFGIAGFVAGPVIAALFLVMWDMFADEYAPLDSSTPGVQAMPPPDAVVARPAAEPADDLPG